MSTFRALVLSSFAALATIAVNPAHAQDATISMNVTSVGFVLGASGGNGVLSYEEKNYPISVGGLSVGFTVGISNAQLSGTVYNLKNLSDIEGTYGGVGAGLAVVGGGSAATLENNKGVKLELSGKEVGLVASIAAGGVTINLK